MIGDGNDNHARLQYENSISGSASTVVESHAGLDEMNQTIDQNAHRSINGTASTVAGKCPDFDELAQNTHRISHALSLDRAKASPVRAKNKGNVVFCLFQDTLGRLLFW